MEETTNTATTVSMAAKGQQVEAAKKTQETELPLYDDFEPLCTWHREEDKDTLVVHLPEFKVDELKVFTSNRGNLKISGERPIINGKGRVRFTKEMKILKNYDASKITAKFTTDGCTLQVTLPKKIIPNSESDAVAADLQPKVGGESGRAGAGAGAKVALSFAVVAAAVAALAVGAYAIFKRGTSSSNADSSAAQAPVSPNI
ncbi:uncharacterized protein LOC127806685 [Diospyros lotus]|uniref:uncharacterized protein LOC127806685 n=1 Tax=Diospyros lotus TaxID=55363 RepID=UPI00225154F5|nr:uncharacterized protein LOC127806685 [Diospyros lotus]